jgi:hypothetical protein
LLQVRSLREELLAARRERAMTEAREAELRREIALLKRQVGCCRWVETLLVVNQHWCGLLPATML